MYCPSGLQAISTALSSASASLSNTLNDEISISFRDSLTCTLEPLFIASNLPSGENSIAETLSNGKLASLSNDSTSKMITSSSCTEAKIVLLELIATKFPSSAS